MTSGANKSASRWQRSAVGKKKKKKKKFLGITHKQIQSDK